MRLQDLCVEEQSCCLSLEEEHHQYKRMELIDCQHEAAEPKASFSKVVEIPDDSQRRKDLHIFELWKKGKAKQRMMPFREESHGRRLIISIM